MDSVTTATASLDPVWPESVSSESVISWSHRMIDSSEDVVLP